MDELVPSAATDAMKPTPGGMYDFFLGGDAYTDVDAEAARRVAAKIPAVREVAHGNRLFLQRATRAMTRAGIRQFIDIGAGLPTQYNTYETARDIAPDAAVVYVDNDPNIYQRALLELSNQRAENVAYIIADVRDPDYILDHPETQELIDFSRPVGYLHTALYHFLPDSDDPVGLVKRYLDAVPSGSYLALSHATSEGQDPAQVAAAAIYRDATAQLNHRTHEHVLRFFDGLELLPPYDDAKPGLVWANSWGASDPSTADQSGSWLWAGVGRKP